MLPSRSRPVDFIRIRELVDARRVLELTGWRPNSRRGLNWRGPCPEHGSRPRSTSLSVCATVCRCFVCNWRADGVGIWARHRHVGVLQAAIEVCGLFNLEVPYIERR